jgi:hypothetical protein
VEELRLIPAGRLPEVTLQVIGAVPDAVKVAEKTVPTAPSARDAGPVITAGVGGREEDSMVILSRSGAYALVGLSNLIELFPACSVTFMTIVLTMLQLPEPVQLRGVDEPLLTVT